MRGSLDEPAALDSKAVLYRVRKSESSDSMPSSTSRSEGCRSPGQLDCCGTGYEGGSDIVAMMN